MNPEKRIDIPDQFRSIWNHTAFHLIIISGLWILSIFLVNPSGNFPLNDDWAYGMTVQRVLSEHTFRPPGWPAMTLISQTLWGVFVSVLFGFSFQTLHLSNLFLSWMVLICFYRVIRELSEVRWHALIGACVLAFNPIYFPLSFTYMTEITFILYITLSFLFFIKNLKHDRNRDILLGTIFTTLAVLCRQNGLFIPISFALSYLVKKKLSWKSIFWASLPTLAGLIALIGYQQWMRESGNLSQSYNLVIEDMIQSIIHHPRQFLYSIPRNCFFSIQYAGYFLLPMLILFFRIRPPRQTIHKIIFGILLFYIAGVGYISFVKGHLMPLFTRFESIFLQEGTGPLTLNDTFIRHLSHVPSLPAGIRVMVTFLSIAGSVILLSYFIITFYRLWTNRREIKEQKSDLLEIFFLLSAVIYVSPLAIATIFFDRYLLPLFIPLSLYVIQTGIKKVPRPNSIVKWGSVLLIAFSACLSIPITHDYLAWNRTRWQALEYLMDEKGVTPDEIDGGFEFNALYSYREDYPIDNVAPGKSWWWVQDDKYLITFGEVPGYRIVQQVSYHRWLPRSGGQIFVLMREESEADREDE